MHCPLIWDHLVQWEGEGEYNDGWHESVSVSKSDTRLLTTATNADATDAVNATTTTEHVADADVANGSQNSGKCNS